MSLTMDRYRIRGPERSIPPYFPPSSEVEESMKMKEGTGVEYRRENGRDSKSVRPVFIRTGLIPQAKGSAYYEAGDTKLVCAVYGPRQIKKQTFLAKGNLYCDFKFATFSCNTRRAHLKVSSEKEMSQMMEQALTPAICLARYPKATIEIFVTVIENGGTMACLAGAISAASVALASAGIEMVDTVTACSAVYIGDQLYLDATQEEEDMALQASSRLTAPGKSAMLVALMPSLNLITHLVQTNAAPSEVSLGVKSIQACTEACHHLHGLIQQVLVAIVDDTDTDATLLNETRNLKIEETEG